MRIQYDDRVVAVAEMPDQVGRTAYRIVQEGLTNVRKHAPGVTVVVQMSGSPAEGVSIRIRNPARSQQGSAAYPHRGPGSGWSAWVSAPSSPAAASRRRRDDGSFELTGWLPWKA